MAKQIKRDATTGLARGLTRSLKIDRSKINKEARTVEISFASENPVDRWGEREVLSHAPGDYDFTRLKGNDHPLMLGHNESNPRDQVGVLENPHVDSDKTSRCTARFGNSALAQEVFQDVCDGIRQLTSVGYDQNSIVSREKGADGKDTVRYKWTPYHVAIVPVPADTRSGIGRDNSETKDCPECGARMPDDAGTCLDCGSEFPERSRPSVDLPPRVNVEAISTRMSDDEKKAMRILLDATSNAGGGSASAVNPLEADRSRRKEIRQIAEVITKDHPYAASVVRDLATEASESDMTLDAFRIQVLTRALGAKPAVETTMESIGADPSKYSLLRAINNCISRGVRVPDGFEGEMHQEACKRFGGTIKPDGFMMLPERGCGTVPRSQRRRMGRDLQVGVFGQGGATVATELVTPIIELLRNRMVCDRLGVISLAGLQGNVAIPRQTAAATAYTLPEISPLTISTQALDQIVLSPHRCGAYNQYSKQLLQQSSIDVENFVRDDLMKVVAIDIDRMILNGQGGGSEPLGILNTPGISSVLFGGTATWAEIVQFETDIAALNADIGEMAYVTSPTAKGRLKSVAKLLVGGSNVSAITPLWDGTMGDSTADGEMNGYRAAATNQIPNNQLLFGVFSQAILAMWGGFDIVVNPFSLDINAEVRITVNTWIDVAVRHAQSFCASADSAAQ